MNLASVLRSTLHILAMLRCETPFFISSDMRTSLLESLFFSGLFCRPFGRPSTTPSAFLRAKASLVRGLIRLRWFLRTLVFSPQQTSKLICVRLIENVLFLPIVQMRKQAPCSVCRRPDGSYP